MSTFRFCIRTRSLNSYLLARVASHNNYICVNTKISLLLATTPPRFIRSFDKRKCLMPSTLAHLIFVRSTNAENPYAIASSTLHTLDFDSRIEYQFRLLYAALRARINNGERRRRKRRRRRMTRFDWSSKTI